MLKSILPMFSPRSFMISGITFKCLSHFEFTVVYGVREQSSLILLYVAVQCSNTVYQRDCLFLIVYSSLLCHKLVYSLNVVHFWSHYSVPLIYVSVFVPVSYCLDYCSFLVQSEVRELDSSSSIFLSHDCLGYSGSFVFPY